MERARASRIPSTHVLWFTPFSDTVQSTQTERDREITPFLCLYQHLVLLEQGLQLQRLARLVEQDQHVDQVVDLLCETKHTPGAKWVRNIKTHHPQQQAQILKNASNPEWQGNPLAQREHLLCQTRDTCDTHESYFTKKDIEKGSRMGNTAPSHTFTKIADKQTATTSKTKQPSPRTILSLAKPRVAHCRERQRFLVNTQRHSQLTQNSSLHNANTHTKARCLISYL